MLKRESWEDKLVGAKEVCSCWLLAAVVLICAAVVIAVVDRLSPPQKITVTSADCGFKYARRSFAEHDEEDDSTCDSAPEHTFAGPRRDHDQELQADASSSAGF